MLNETTNKTNGEHLLDRTMDILYTENNFILIIFILILILILIKKL